MRSRASHRAIALSAILALAIATPASAVDPFDDGAVPIASDADESLHHHQHGGVDGHLPAGSSNVELVGSMRINQDQEGRVADVGVLGNYAYLAAWSAPNCQKGGVYVFDISNPASPKQISFIRTANDSYSGEGIQAIHLSTMTWTGDLLAFNNEDCLDKSQGINNPAGKTSKHSIGGFTLVDVTNPKVPKDLVRGFGDHDTPTLTGEADAHEIHSIFVWEDENGTVTDADDRAYAIVTDNEELEDTDIFEITDPRNPVMVGEWDLDVTFPQIIQADLGDGSSFLHDEVVKQIGSDYVALLSYWDGGYVALNVNDPANPTYIGDTDFTNPDPELLESTGAVLPPEGNAHEAEFTKDSNFIVAADEDFGPFAPFISIDGGPATPFSAGVATGPSLGEGDSLTGDTRFQGLGCTPFGPDPGTATIVVMERGVCAFQQKLDNASAAGYEAAIIMNSETGVPGCEALVNMLATTDIISLFVSRSVGYAMLGVGGYNPANCPGGANPALPAAGTAGLPIEITVDFDGWGYVHLYSYPGMVELDTYAIPQAHDVNFASGFGDLSVHEAATSAVENDLVYFSYYSAGFRVARIVPDGVGGFDLNEVGWFIDGSGDGGNNFWGVQVWQHEGQEYVLASDRDYGVYIFQYTGP